MNTFGTTGFAEQVAVAKKPKNCRTYNYEFRNKNNKWTGKNTF